MSDHDISFKKNRKLLSIYCTLALCASVVSSLFTPIEADAEARTDAETKIVKVGYYENDTFQAGASDELVKSGYSYEYMQRLLLYTNWEYEYVYGEYGDLYDQLVSGDIDLLTGLAYKPEREEIISYPTEAMGDTDYSFLKRTSDTTITSDYRTIQGKRIGVVDGAMKGITEKYLADHEITAELVLFNDIKARDNALIKGDIDISIVESNGTGVMEGIEAFAEAGATDYYVCVNKKRPDILEDLNQAQSKLFKSNPKIKETLNSTWFRQTTTSTSLNEEERKWVEEHDTFTVGYFNGYLPYSATDSKGNVTGLIKDLVPEIFHTLKIYDITLNYRGYNSTQDMQTALKNGEVDAIFPAYSDFWCAEQYSYMPTDPAITTFFNLIYVGEYPDMDEAKIAIRGDNELVKAYAQIKYPNNPLVICDSIYDCLDAVEAGVADATLISGLRTDYILRSRTAYKNLLSVQVAGDAPVGFGLRRTDTETVELLNHGISLLDPDYALTHTYQYEEKHITTVFEFILDNIWVPLMVIFIFAAVVFIFVYREYRKNTQTLAIREKEQKELEKAKNEAEAANKAKSAFLFNMSHDIRTPLNAIIGFTDLEEKHADDPVVVNEYRKKIKLASHQLLDILDNVLEMARIENKKLVIEEELTDAHEFFDTWTTVFEGEMSKKNQTLETKVEVYHRYLYLDSTHLSEVLMNVVSNSVKYTPNGGHIYAGIKEFPCEKPGECIIETTIRDNGIGMSKEFVEHIFDVFSRERNSSQSGIQGTGLGMAIVKSMVDMMHGTVVVKSYVGKGTEVVIRLPHRYGEEAEYKSTSGAEIDKSSFVGKRILMAEDNDLNAEIALELLKEQGLIVDRASDGIECVDMLGKTDAGYYDLILMDIQMPNMNGYDATKRIRSMDDPIKSQIPIIAMTANAFNEDRLQAKEAGMNGHIAKPIDVNKMFATIKDILNPKIAITSCTLLLHTTPVV